MKNINKRLLVAATTVFVALGAGSLAINATETEQSSPAVEPTGPVSCEILTTQKGGMTIIETLVHSEIEIEGSYQFSMSSSARSGSSKIRQGGSFYVKENSSATLGKTMLGGNGTYEANLTIYADGAEFECETNIGEKA